MKWKKHKKEWRLHFDEKHFLSIVKEDGLHFLLLENGLPCETIPLINFPLEKLKYAKAIAEAYYKDNK